MHNGAGNVGAASPRALHQAPDRHLDFASSVSLPDHAINGPVGPFSDRFSECTVPHDECTVVVHCETLLESPFSNPFQVLLSSVWLAQVVRACASGDESEAIGQRSKRTERIGRRAFKPAVHSCADTRENGAPTSSLFQNLRQPVQALNGQQIGSRAPADKDDVLIKQRRRIRVPPGFLAEQ